MTTEVDQEVHTALEPARVRPPVFITGCHRSGTTVLRRILNAHPHLCCPPETKFIAAFDEVLRYPQALRGFESIGVSADRLLLELGQLTDRFMRDFAAGQGKRRWIDKTPNYFRILPTIDRMFAGRALYLGVVRHPLDTIQSLAETPEFSTANPEDRDIADARRDFGAGRLGWAGYWNRVYGEIVRFASLVPARVRFLRYEDLVREPDSELSQLLDWMGETTPGSLIGEAFTQHLHRGYGDWKIHNTDRVHRASVGRWRTWHADDVATIWPVVCGLASSFDYGIT